MKTVNLNFKFPCGGNYYSYAVNKASGEIVQYVNAGCLAAIYSHLRNEHELNAAEVTRIFHVTSAGKNDIFNLQLLPKKYQKLVKA